MLRRIALNPFICLSYFFASAAFAACEGRDLSADWTPEFRAAIETRAADVPFGEGRYFEVEKNGVRSILFGTIHIADEEVAILPEGLAARIEDARELLVELSEEEERRMTRSLVLDPSAILAPEGRMLSQNLTRPEWLELTRLLRPFSIEPDFAERIAPWYLLVTLSNPPCVMEYVARGERILDRRIESMAREAGVEISGLETFEEVFGLFADLPYETQVALLRTSLPTFALSEDYLETTRQLYLDGEIAQIEAFGAELMTRSGEDAEAAVSALMDRLLVQRNARWLERLAPKLDQGDLVIAVGALHLGGEDGLLVQLQNRGWSVRRLDG